MRVGIAGGGQVRLEAGVESLAGGIPSRVGCGGGSRQTVLDDVTISYYHCHVKVVGIRQLKARLSKARVSKYIRLANTGETVRVARREVVAERRPARRQTPVGHRVEEVLEKLAAAGEVTSGASERRPGVVARSRGLGLAPGTAQALTDSKLKAVE